MLSKSFKTFASTTLTNSSSPRMSNPYTLPFRLIHDGLRAFKFFLDNRPNKEPSTSVLVRLAELVPTINNFSFDGEHYQQINGVAIRTKMGPNYANLFVGFVEKQIFEQYTDPIPD